MSMFARSDKTSDGSQASGKVAGEAAASAADEGPRTTRSGGTPVPSVIGTGLKVKGDLETAGEIQVNGEVEGDVRGKTVIIGEGAVVKGSIFGDTISVSGTIEGKVEAMTVTVESTARLTGDIIHETVKIAQGAYVDGRCSPHFGKAEGRPAVAASSVSSPGAVSGAPSASTAQGESDKPGKATGGKSAEGAAKIH